MRTSADFRQQARAALAGRWGISLAVTLVAALLGGYSGGFGTMDFTFNVNDVSTVLTSDGLNLAAIFAWLGVPFGSLGSVFASVAGALGLVGIAQLVVGGAVELGHSMYYLRLVRGEDAGIDSLFSRFGIFLKALGLRLYMTLFILLWSLLLIIPGIVASYRYRMAPYLMAEHPEMGIREAVEESKRLTMGHKGRWFLLNLSFIGWGILCAFTLGIGALWLNPYMSAADAAFYLDLMGEQAGAGFADDGPEFQYNGPERL